MVHDYPSKGRIFAPRTLAFVVGSQGHSRTVRVDYVFLSVEAEICIVSTGLGLRGIKRRAKFRGMWRCLVADYFPHSHLPGHSRAGEI